MTCPESSGRDSQNYYGECRGDHAAGDLGDSAQKDSVHGRRPSPTAGDCAAVLAAWRDRAGARALSPMLAHLTLQVTPRRVHRVVPLTVTGPASGWPAQVHLGQVDVSTLGGCPTRLWRGPQPLARDPNQEIIAPTHVDGRRHDCNGETVGPESAPLSAAVPGPLWAPVATQRWSFWAAVATWR